MRPTLNLVTPNVILDCSTRDKPVEQIKPATPLLQFGKINGTWEIIGSTEMFDSILPVNKEICPIIA